MKLVGADVVELLAEFGKAIAAFWEEAAPTVSSKSSVDSDGLAPNPKKLKNADAGE